MLINPPLSLYVHIPWCVRKCPYCDFNSHGFKHDSQVLPEDQYIDRLLRDLELELPAVWGRRLHSIFIGGGTPSLFSPQAIDKLLSGIRALIPFEGDIEITMEANPGTFEAEKFAGFRHAGVNRLSIGVQSFNPNHLKELGRIHDPDQAIAAAEFAQQAGFKSFNLDLMHGLPNQTLKQALTDLEIAIKIGPQHLSWYQLTIEPNTLFYQQPPQLPQDELLWDIQEQGALMLAKHGYQQYEISAYAQAPSMRSQHNLNYWQFGDYLGIGAGAHGKITRLDLNQIQRTHKARHPNDYLNNDWSQVRNIQAIAKDELAFEFMLNALRLIDGVPHQLFSQHTGLHSQTIQPIIAQAIQDELLQDEPDRIGPTQKGSLFLNELLHRFIDPVNDLDKDKSSIPITNL
ncbi:MAG: radical SAM family heme chaperone HemW [Kangiellaceae bacterium]|nr:radical SAM family heme chaperone HemW [Kangiellaceae bacterium]